MPARLLAAGLCAAAALGTTACGGASNPPAGSGAARALPGGPPKGRGVIDDPRVRSRACLLETKLPLVPQGRTVEYIGQGADRARIVFLPTPGAAQYAQISGGVQGAEVIGSALLYPQGMADAHLKQVEKCLAKGVTG